MAWLTRWTWVWVNSGSWWWTGRPGMLRFMGSQRVGHDWATDLIWSDLMKVFFFFFGLASCFAGSYFLARDRTQALAWKPQTLTTGPPSNSLYERFLNSDFCISLLAAFILLCSINSYSSLSSKHSAKHFTHNSTFNPHNNLMRQADINTFVFEIFIENVKSIQKPFSFLKYN